MNIKKESPFKELEEKRLKLAIQANLKQEKEFEEKRKRILNNLIHMFYDNFKKHFDSGDLIFTGSLIHNITGLYKTDKIGDLDISIIQGNYGEKIIDELKEYLTQPNLVVDGKYVERIWDDGRRGWYINRYVSVDIFRNPHPKEFSEDIIVKDNIITKYFGDKWIYDITYKKYLIWKEKDIKTEWGKEKIIKYENLLKNMEKYGKI
jgi:hypothetical protein